ncbi:hypothetical protein AB1L42_11095 [Thalassoglobus sp. JC818]|uniref:hypothetical protein n=1 Tax=Thalassoglobus sp. JC818 TaxID=3232136 RepID=UPI0034579A05
MTNNLKPSWKSSVVRSGKRWKPRRWATVGFAVACVPIAAFGAYGIYVDAQYAATLPPDEPRCGNVLMAAMFMIFPISPMIGCVGALIGYVSAVVLNAASHRQTRRGRDR